MNLNYFKTVFLETKELAFSQVLIVFLLFIQISVVTRGLGTSNYGRAALVLADFPNRNRNALQLNRFLAIL